MKKRNIKLIGIVVAIVVIGGVFVAPRVYPRKDNNASIWYAVHLSTNQIYFGHIAEITDSAITLADAHFVEAYQDPVTKSTSKSFALVQTPPQTYRVVQVGDQSSLATGHVVYLNRSLVLYWEKVSPESEIGKLLQTK